MAEASRFKTWLSGLPGMSDLSLARVLRLSVTLGTSALVFILVGAPLVFFVWGSFWSSPPGLGGSFTVSGYTRLFQPLVFDTFVNSSIIAVGGTITALVLGLSTVLLTAKTRIPGRDILSYIVIIQYMLPSFLLALSWGTIAGPNGVLNKLLLLLPFVHAPVFNVYSVWGIMIVTGTHYAGLVYLLTSSSVSAIPASLEEAARLSGSSPRQIISSITLPLVIPAISISAVLIVSRLFQSFGAPLILGSRSNTYVLATLMYFALQQYPPDFNVASAIGIIILFITVLALLIQTRLVGPREQYEIIAGQDTGGSVRFTVGRQYLVVGIFLTIVGFLFVLPYLSLLLSSFQQAFFGLNLAGNVRWSLENYRILLFGIPSDTFWLSLFNSLVISGVGAFLGMFVASLASFVIIKSDSILAAPVNYLTVTTITLPGIVVGTTFLWIFLTYNFLGLYNTVWLIILALTVRFLVYGTRAANSAFNSVDDILEESARLSGANVIQVLRTIYWPLIKPGFASGYVLLFIDYMKVLSIPAILGGPDSEVIQTLIWNFWQRGDPELAASTATIMVLLILGTYLGAAYFLGTDIRELV